MENIGCELFTLKFTHNNEINRQDHTRFKPVSQETKEDLTPSVDWEQHRKKVHERFPKDYGFKFVNRQICPDYFWGINFYR